MSFLAGVGADALGLLIGNLSGTYGTGDTLNEKRRKDAESDALAMERHGIVNRVEGYKAAGLHPVLAAGATPYQAQVSSIGTEMPSRGYSSSPEPDPNIARINEANARRAEAEAKMSELELARRNSQNALANQPGQTKPLITSDANAGQGGAVVIKPDEVVAGRGGHTAGTHPGMTRFEFPGIPGGLSLPSAAGSQSLEDLEALKYAAIASANWDRLLNAAREIDYKLGKTHPWYKELMRAKEEVENLRKRHPPKGDYYISPRSRGGVVR